MLLLRKILFYVANGLVAVTALLAVGILAILGFDEPWLVDSLIGAEVIKEHTDRIISGGYDRGLKWIFLFLSLILLLAINVVFLAEPAKEALRRVRTRSGVFFSDKRLAKDMIALSVELRQFLYERRSARPGGSDRMNFDFSIEGSEPQWPAYAQMNIASGADSDLATRRLVQQRIEERRNFDLYTLHIYNNRFSARVRVVLDELGARKIICKEQIEYTRWQLDQGVPMLEKLDEFCAFIESTAIRLQSK